MPAMDHAAAHSPRASAIDLRWLLSVVAGALPSAALAGPGSGPTAAVALGEAAEPVRPEITAARAFVTKVN